MRKLLRHRAGGVGLVLVFTLLLTALTAPVISPYEPNMQNLSVRLQPGFWAGNLSNPLGTDELGRDVLSRIIHGSRVSLLVGLVAVSSMALIGASIGVIAGYFGGWVDAVLMRVVDMFLAFPTILLAIAIVASLGPGVEKAMIALVMVFAPRMARIIRSATIVIREVAYVTAAQSLGSSDTRVLLRHVLPNVTSNIITFTTLFMGQAILFMASLGFLGLGVQPPTAEWGAMIGRGKDLMIVGSWWVSTFPGLAILLSVLGFILLGDALRDVLDPRLVQLEVRKTGE